MPQGQTVFRDSMFIPVGNIDWMQDARCKDMDTSIFFPTVGDTNRFKAIKNLCEPCPVRLRCLKFAFDQGFEDGWFGGVSPRDRMKIMRSNNE